MNYTYTGQQALPPRDEPMTRAIQGERARQVGRPHDTTQMNNATPHNHTMSRWRRTTHMCTEVEGLLRAEGRGQKVCMNRSCSRRESVCGTSNANTRQSLAWHANTS